MRNEVINTNICGLKVQLTTDNLHIEDSYKVGTTKDMDMVLDTIREYVHLMGIKMDTPLNHRSNKSLKKEWITHNNLYVMDLFTERTKSVDFSYPQSWYEKLGYTLGSLYLL